MISIVIPCHNEEKYIEKAYKRIRKIFPKEEIIIFDDASIDKTYDIAKDIAKKDKKVKVIHTKERIGKGASLSKAMKIASGEYVFFIDADLSADPSEIKKLLYWLEKGYPIVIGSRYKAKRSLFRKILSKGFNLLVKIASGSKVKDHQCGLKGFEKKAVLKILPYVKDKHFFWDAELLIKAQWLGLKIKEVHIKWKERKETKVRFGKDVKDMFFGSIRILFERIFKINRPKKMYENLYSWS